MKLSCLLSPSALTLSVILMYLQFWLDPDLACLKLYSVVKCEARSSEDKKEVKISAIGNNVSNQQFSAGKIKKLVRTVFGFTVFGVFEKPLTSIIFFFCPCFPVSKMQRKPLSFTLDRLNEDFWGRKAQTETKENLWEWCIAFFPPENYTHDNCQYVCTCAYVYGGFIFWYINEFFPLVFPGNIGTQSQIWGSWTRSSWTFEFQEQSRGGFGHNVYAVNLRSGRMHAPSNKLAHTHGLPASSREPAKPKERGSWWMSEFSS